MAGSLAPPALQPSSPPALQPVLSGVLALLRANTGEGRQGSDSYLVTAALWTRAFLEFFLHLSVLQGAGSVPVCPLDSGALSARRLTLHFTALNCSILQCSAMQCSAVQFSAVH